jgi:hypothetical protein
MPEPTDVRDRELSPFTKKVFAASAEYVEWYTAPIGFANDPNMPVTVDRTGVFLRIGGQSFILSAAHDFKAIIDSGYRPCILMPKPDLKAIFCGCDRSLFANHPEVDLAVVLLEQEVVDYVGEHYRFLRISDLMPPDHVAHEGAVYLVTGFPNALYGRDDAGIKRCEIWRYLTIPYTGNYQNVRGYDPSIHIILEYERDTLSREGKTVHPPGMSGSGIWFVGNPLTTQFFSVKDFRLVGIQNAWRKEFEYAKGTWIKLALQMIWRYFPDSRDVMRFHGIEF